VSNKTDVWNLLLSRLDTWVTRTEIEFVGGAEGMRRLRELRDGLYAQGYSLAVRTSAADGRTQEYRLSKVASLEAVSETEPRTRWRCVKCGFRPSEGTQPSMDERWRIGPCHICKRKDATFEKDST
jgi:hypothetical protein